MLQFLQNKKHGLVVPADIALQDKKDGYVCPGCGCDLYPVPSARGNVYGKCYPGRRHAEDCPCVKLAGDKQYYNLNEIEIGALDTGIMEPVSGGEGGTEGGNPGEPRVDKERVKSFSSLKDIYQLGLLDARDFVINDKTRLKHILLNRYTMYAVMRANVDIGKRAVVAKPDFAIRSRLTIRFAACTQVKQGDAWVKKQKVFDLRFCDQREFERYVNKIFKRAKDVNGKLRYQSRYNHVLIYGHWKALDAVDCWKVCGKKCDGSWACSGYQYADCVVPAHQIYCPPTMKLFSR